MQASLVMLIALGGLGCQNPASNLPPIPAVAAESAAPSSAYAPAYIPPATAYTAYAGSPAISDDVRGDDSFRHCVRSTIWSFVLGRDPDVASARQIEEAYYAGRYGH